MAVAVKTSVVKRVVESYAACAIQLAELVKNKRDDNVALMEQLHEVADKLHAKGIAAHAAAASNDVLAAKWLPPASQSRP